MMAEATEPTLAKLLGDAPRIPLDAMTDINTATIPVDYLEQDLYDWYARHNAEVAMTMRLRVGPKVVLIGDSITHFWGGEPNATIVNGPRAWRNVFGDDMGIVNLGFGWDRTQNVLWRLRQGEFTYRPDWIVLNIGTNNLSGTSHSRANTPEEIVEGISAIIEELKVRSPKSHVILMAIFPRGKNPDNPFRARIQKTNELLARHFASAKEVTFLDIGAKFLAADGTIPATLMPDATHPSDAGYQIWADALIQAGIKK
jgi:lysophospholipase L1-like esterase